ncbi:MMPL family transporter [Marinactinospora rubrisoli]|uniref:MMPL family transporter n=1 Tax=Marinactinospora rubrisoli TaxID=2715399 RepID=A0ABW2KES9_9ACTN
MRSGGWPDLLVRRRWWVLVATILIVAACAPAAAGTLERLSLSRFAVPGSESDRASAQLAEMSGTGSPNVALMVIPASGNVDDESAAALGRDLTTRLQRWPGVASAWSYWTEDAATMRAGDGSAAWVFAHVPGDADTVRTEVLPGLAEEFGGADATARVVVAGADEVFRQVSEQARADFLRAEIIVLPLVLGLLWVVYRRFRAALLTLGLGVGAVVGGLALLRPVTALTEVSTFASNVVLVLGIGLGVDYGLFVVFRFREELARHRDVPSAIAATTRGAGRTVLFSAATVAAALSVLFVFPYPFLRSFAYAGVAVVLVAALLALVALPAALAVLGRTVLRRGGPEPAVERRVWFRLPAAVMRRPVLLGGAGLLVVLALAAPVLGVRFGLPDDRVLPASADVRGAYDIERAAFAGQDSDALLVVTPAELDEAALASYAEELSLVDGVLRVDTAIGAFAAGERAGDAPVERLASDSGTWLSLTPSSVALTEDVTGLVGAVRDVPAPADVLVGGYPAELVDYRDGVTAWLPLVGGLIVVVTFAVLFLMTGSIVVPLQATVLNLLSMAVMVAVLVWGFQEGGLSPLMGFTPTGSIEPSIPILMFCIAYGLSMDYAVFLLARIREEVAATGDVTASVPRGIARSGPLVTAAAITLAASFLVYATGGVVFLQQLGIGMAVAVLVDATLVRGLLLPFFMRVSGSLTWWAPRPLRALHARIGLAES